MNGNTNNPAFVYQAPGPHRGDTVGYLEREVNRLVGKCIHAYGLLSHGDRILVAVSGGADSLLALYFLTRWQKKAPIDFGILPVYLDMGFEASARGVILDHLLSLGLSFHVEDTDYGVLAHSPFNRKRSPCFLCSMLRRKRLFELAHAFGCNKLCLGHNQDDIIETFFMNLLFSGELSTMVPRQEMFKGLITIIRPLGLVPKEKVNRLATELGLPVLKNPCPSAGLTKRKEVKTFLEGVYKRYPGVRGVIMRALSNVKREYLL